MGLEGQLEPERKREKEKHDRDSHSWNDTRYLSVNRGTGTKQMSNGTLVRGSSHRSGAVQRAFQVHPNQNALKSSNRWWSVFKSPCGVPYILK